MSRRQIDKCDEDADLGDYDSALECVCKGYNLIELFNRNPLVTTSGLLFSSVMIFAQAMCIQTNRELRLHPMRIIMYA
jgi:hypothetical protein